MFNLFTFSGTQRLVCLVILAAGILFLLSVGFLIVGGFFFKSSKYEQKENPTIQPVERKQNHQNKKDTKTEFELEMEKIKIDLVRVAILVVDDLDGNAENFYELTKMQLQDAYNESYAKIRYFVFSNRKFKVKAAHGDTLITVPRGDYSDPCGVYVENSQKHDYFDNDIFHFVLSFNPRMEFVRRVVLIKELLGGDRIALVHPVFRYFKDRRLCPYDRRPKSCAYVAYGSETSDYYAGEIFGGKPALTRDFCEKIVDCQKAHVAKKSKAPEFHQLVNFYYKLNPPTFALSSEFIDPDSIIEWSLDAGIQFDDKIPRHDGPNTTTFTYDESFFKKREIRVQKLTETIDRNYKNKITAKFQANSSTLEFLAYICDDERDCGGYGAFRGAATTLYMAIGTNRVFDLRWMKPIDVGRIFVANEEFYGLPPLMPRYEAGRLQTPTNSCSDFHWDSDQLIYDQSQHFTVLRVATNQTHSLMTFIFQHRDFYPNFHEVIPDIPEYKSNIDYTDYLSAAMRIIFGKLRPEAEKIVNEIVAQVSSTSGNWSTAVKIGVQIQFCPTPSTFDDQTSANCNSSFVTFDVVQCFAYKLIEICKTRMEIAENLIVFLSTDGGTAVNEKLRQLISTNVTIKQVNVFDTRALGVLPEDESTWRPIIDWHLLTKMDWLLISRDYYGEAASLISLKPTERLLNSENTCSFGWYNLDITQTEDS